MANVVRWKTLKSNAVIPQYQTAGANGFDFVVSDDITIPPYSTGLVKTGLAVELPESHALFVLPRGGTSLKSPIRIANAPGLVDEDYRGEIGLIVDNMSMTDELVIKAGDRIAQGVVLATPQFKFEAVEVLNETERGEGAYGHTGNKAVTNEK